MRPILQAISKAASRRRRVQGQTLMEMTVVIVVLLLLAAAILPNYVAVKRSRDLLDLEGSLVRLPLEAKNEARKSQLPVTLSVSGNAIVMERTPTDGSSAVQVKQVALSSDMQMENAQSNGTVADIGTWKWVVYPDGSSDSGALEFSEGRARRTLLLPSNGNAVWIDGDMPDTTQDTWPAGDLQTRA